ncbi:MAG: YidC/Oxa1 family membrane protein insertase [Pseudobdellovibrionaceae bacterium]
MDTIVSIFSSSLSSLHLFFGSWPIAITIFATLLRITLFPIQFFNFKQQRLILKIQPELEALQKKYKEEPSKLFAEMNSVKAREGVKSFWMLVANLIQLPIFISIYRAFSMITSLSGESFIWIASLSAPDPLFILPAFVAASGFLQQNLNKSKSQSPSPQMGAVVKFLPIVSMIFMAAMPASMTLYYAMSGIVQFASDFIIRKMA